MTACSPVLPSEKDNHPPEVVYAKNQPQYKQLPVIVGSVGMVTARFKLTWSERISVLWNGSLWLQVLTFGNKLQPVKVWAKEPKLKDVV